MNGKNDCVFRFSPLLDQDGLDIYLADDSPDPTLCLASLTILTYLTNSPKLTRLLCSGIYSLHHTIDISTFYIILHIFMQAIQIIVCCRSAMNFSHVQ